MKFKVLILFFLCSSYFYAQKLSENSVNKVYDDIIDAIGNNNPRPPKLIIKKSEKNPASYLSDKKIINIENKVLEICYSFGKDSLNALSYILAHELGHHYRNHGWTTQFASLDFSNEIDKKTEDDQQRVDDETEADVYAGFYAHIAGYDALSLAERFLDQIYIQYNLPDSLPNYPTLQQRKKIINENKRQFEKLKNIFEIANITMSTGNYDYAQELFSYILNQGFTSREIYNNLGLSYIYEALNLGLEESLFKCLIPFELDLDSRLITQPKTRSLNDIDKAKDLFNNAIEQFNTALQLDPNYSYAKKNHYFANIALSILENKEKENINIENISDLDNTCKFCVYGLNEISNKRLRKSKSFFKKGAKSSCNICTINLDFDKNKISDKSLINQKNTNYEFDDCRYFRSNDCNMYKKLYSTKLCVNNEKDMNTFKLKRKLQGRSSCIEIKEIKNNNVNNSIDINIGDSIDALKDYNLKIVKAGNTQYSTIVNKNITFVSENNIIYKWLQSHRID
tara:strand:- start:8638 stop:10170 length:1533 start_codon:yes stop_codon:yes gene_type:complete